MINRGYKDPWRHPHKLAGCHSELSGVVTPQGHSLLRSVIKLCKLGRLIFFRIVLKKHVLNGHMQYKHEEVHASFHQQI